ncbi:MAG: hypothetical protein JXA67_02860 [Micromonosporaceae bacterium]|nr:hypothetical protein [Micromonosporaceae bacterium]
MARPASITTNADSFICDDCAARYHTRCSGCDQWHPAGSNCPDCVTCDRCDATVPETDAIETVRGSTICDACRRDCYWQCPACDGWNRDGYRCGNDCHDPDNYDCDCEDCRNNRWSGPVYDYDYKPTPIFHGSGPLFLGPEIEVETPYARTEECVEVAHAHLGDLGYLKTDASLLNGFEIVTHPMSYTWAMANFPWQMLTELSSCGASATDNTGLHVHVSRAAFISPCHTYRWMKFIYRNQQQVETLARRSATCWAAFTADDRRAVKDYAKGARSERYRAINTGNRDTFELRVFASSLDPVEVQAALGFASASIEYTGQLTVPAVTRQGAWNWPAFAGWLAERPIYAPLHRQLKDLSCVC